MTGQALMTQTDGYTDRQTIPRWGWGGGAGYLYSVHDTVKKQQFVKGSKV
jgi:hypothetical protein